MRNDLGDRADRLGKDAPTRPARRLSGIFVGLCLVLALGFLLRVPCSSTIGSRAFTEFCYTDIVSIYHTHRLDLDRIPYFEEANEYPALMAMVMWLTALPVTTAVDYFILNALLLSSTAVLTTGLLGRLVGRRAAFFALAPTLLLGSFLNWDLLTVFIATAAIFAYLRGREGLAGLFLGIGAATKFFPILFVLPIAIGMFRDRRRRALTRFVLAAAGAWLVANAFFIFASFDGWSYFYRASSERPVDWATIWSVACRILTGRPQCGGGHIQLLNLLSISVFSIGSIFVWQLKRARSSNFPRWTFCFPLVILFLLTNKVYSPQYSLWLLPWFALVLPDVRLFVLFELADVAVFFSEFSFLGRMFGLGGLPVEVLEIAVLLRAAILVLILREYVIADEGVFLVRGRVKQSA
jgi:uncharacterized membrane protein